MTPFKTRAKSLWLLFQHAFHLAVFTPVLLPLSLIVGALAGSFIASADWLDEAREDWRNADWRFAVILGALWTGRERGPCLKDGCLGLREPGRTLCPACEEGE